MPIDPWIARGGVPLEVDNTLARIGALKQRDQMLDQDAQQNAFMQQRYGAQQAEDDEDDAEWDAAYAARDWGAMAKIDPQAAKAIYDFENKQPQAASLPGEIQRYLYGLENPGFREYEDRNRPQPQPRQPEAPPKPVLTDVRLPDGRIQKQWLLPGESQGTPVGAPGTVDAPKPAQMITPAEAAGYRGVASKAVAFDGALKRLEDDIAANGLKLGAYGAAGGRQAGLYKAVLMKLKEVQNLGVLNGPDLMLLTQQIADPTSFEQYVKNPTLAQSLPEQIRALRTQASSEKEAALAVLRDSNSFIPASVVIDEAKTNGAPRPQAKPQTGDLSPEEKAELEALRKKHRK